MHGLLLEFILMNKRIKKRICGKCLILRRGAKVKGIGHVFTLCTNIHASTSKYPNKLTHSQQMAQPHTCALLYPHANAHKSRNTDVH